MLYAISNFNYYGLLQAVIALFVIVDPLGNLPIFMSLTENLDEKERLKQFRNAVLFGLILIGLFTFFGSLVLNAFHITLRDFKIAGGILLLAIAINLLIRGHHRIEGGEEEIGIMPLGCPLLVGPGAITTAMVLIGSVGLLCTSLAIAITFTLTLFILHYGEIFYAHLGGIFFKAVSRVMVIILAAIAVQFISNGLLELIWPIR
jgi:multiple antibiotic resistance protein